VRLAGLLAACLLAAAPALAVLPTRFGRETGRRFGTRSRALSVPTIGADLKHRAVAAYNAGHPGGAGRLGVSALRRSLGPADVQTAARSFLSETQASLGIDPQQLELLRTTEGGAGDRHALYRQVYKGLPVEFSKVKVHFDGSGKVLDVNSNFRRDIDLDVRPDVAASVAAYTVKKDLGADTRAKSELVVVLDPQDAHPRLAWKIKANKGGRWVYFVDAHTGELILRYDDLRYACGAGDAQGRIAGMLYPYDQQHGQLTELPISHEWVYLANDPTALAETDANGQYCFQGKTGKVFTFLQGPNIRVGNFRGIAAHYDNGSGTWTSAIATPASSPHPYPNNADLTTAVDAGAVNPSVLAVAPVFTNFDVGQITAGSVGEAADITDDDQVEVIDSSGNPVAFYVGSRGGFTGTPVAGKKYTLRLRSNDSGTLNGYDIAASSGLLIATPNGNGSAPPGALQAGPGGSTNGSFDWWPGSYTATGLRTEVALFYHLNTMHDWFNNGVNAAGKVYLNPVSAMTLIGPDIVNAFYDPEYDDFAFGDESGVAPSDMFTDDATVPHHEFTHFVVQKIWNIQNFGEAGAISEGNADYFSATSLGDDLTGTAKQHPNSSSIGKAVNEALGNVGPLRELDGTKTGGNLALGSTCPGSNSGCTTQSWTGEIHTDSVFMSQSLWDMRAALIGSALGANPGAACADQLEFQALMFFPESFAELIDAITQVDKIGSAASCGGANRVAALTGTTVAGFFARHGLPLGAGGVDPYDTASRHNDGFETAVDISTLGAVSATIFPGSDIDFYTFAAGPGPVTVELDLPAEGAYYSGYMFTLFDKDHNQVAQGMPNYDGINTNFGYCTQHDCTTSAQKVTVTYMNPTGGQFFVEVNGGPTDQGGSNSEVNNTAPYSLRATFSRPSSLTAGIVSAQVDQDRIDFSVEVTTWTSIQDYRFSWAQLRDQAQKVLQDTDAPAQTVGTKYLTLVGGAANALGKITGTVRLANGFNARFPAVGTVYLEVFGYNVMGSTVSLGLSNPLNLTTNASEVKAWNNVFNPLSGQKTTVRYDLQSAGHLTMRLYTPSGLLVQTLFDGEVQAGKGSVDWTGQNLSGATVASGIYLLHIQGPGISKTQKIAVIK
jgi:Zn-dependent metalloprotease